MEERATACEIQFGMFDVTAQADSTPACTDIQPFTDLNQLKRQELPVENYASCERNHFVLSGGMKLFPDHPEAEAMGLWSASMSDDSGVFSEPVVLDVAFSENHSSIGLTFRFQEGSGDCCSHLLVEWLDEKGTLMAGQEFFPDSGCYFADRQVNDYRRVTITFYGTNFPRRRLRVAEVIYGAVRIFGSSELISANAVEEVDPVSTQLTINTMNFKFHSGTSEFAILDMKGVWSLLQWKQRMRVYEIVNGERYFMGTYYLDEPEADTENTTTMNCVDLLGIIDQTDFKGGIYTNVKAGDLVSAIMESAGEPGSYEMDADLAEQKISGWIPVCTHREALQQAAFAAGAAVDCSRSEVIRLFPVPQVISGTIGHDRKTIGHKLKMSTLVTGVEVTAHSYVPENAADKYQELQNGVLPAGEQEITFSGPMHALTVSGATIVKSNANYALLKVTTAGNVLLKGRPYNDNTSVYGTYMPELPAGGKANVIKIEDATMIGPGNAQAAAQRVYEYSQMRYEDNGGLILHGEKTGTRVLMDSMGGRQLEGIVESLDIDLTGGFLAEAKITGKAVST